MANSVRSEGKGQEGAALSLRGLEKLEMRGFLVALPGIEADAH